MHLVCTPRITAANKYAPAIRKWTFWHASRTQKVGLPPYPKRVPFRSDKFGCSRHRIGGEAWCPALDGTNCQVLCGAFAMFILRWQDNLQLFGRYVEVEFHTTTGRVDIVMKTALPYLSGKWFLGFHHSHPPIPLTVDFPCRLLQRHRQWDFSLPYRMPWPKVTQALVYRILGTTNKPYGERCPNRVSWDSLEGQQTLSPRQSDGKPQTFFEATPWAKSFCPFRAYRSECT